MEPMNPSVAWSNFVPRLRSYKITVRITAELEQRPERDLATLHLAVPFAQSEPGRIVLTVLRHSGIAAGLARLSALVQASNEHSEHLYSWRNTTITSDCQIGVVVSGVLLE